MSMSETLYRQMKLLRLLPRKPRKIDSATLKSKLENRGIAVEMRTLQRDLENMLDGGLPIIRDKRSKPYGWSWDGDEAFELSDMDPQTALAFDMAGKLMQRTLPGSTMKYLHPYITRAQNILNTLADTSEIGQWKNKVKVIPSGMKFIPPELLPEVVDTVYEALLVDKRLRASYQKPDGQFKDFELHPLGLVMRDNTTYLVASNKEYNNPLHLPLHRFKSAELLDLDSTPIEDFDLDDYANNRMGYPVSNDKAQLKLRFNSGAAKSLIENPLSEDQRQYKEGENVIIEASVSDNLQLRWWLQAFGSKVEVLEPTSLRKEFAALSKQMVEMYS